MASPNTTTSTTKLTFVFSTPINDADKEGVSKDEMARLILRIDPAKEPDRALRAVESHLARARWMTKVGYNHLALAVDPGGACDPAARLRSIPSDDHRAKH